MPAFTEENTAKSVATSLGQIHYQEAGQGHPIIMIHGSGPGASGWTNFGANIGALSARYRVIALDLPGWGSSPAFDPTGTPLFSMGVEAVIQLMDALNIPKAAIVGNSLGGAISLEMAARHPERVSHLITMGSGVVGFPNVYSPGGLTEGLRIVLETFREPTPENFRRMVSIFVYDQAFVTDDLCRMRSERALKRPELLGNFLQIMSRGMPGLTTLAPGEGAARLAAFQAPSLFIHGRDDRVVPMENSLNLVSWIPNASAHIFNRCGHWAQIEHAAAFNALVDGFLETHGAA